MPSITTTTLRRIVLVLNVSHPNLVNHRRWYLPHQTSDTPVNPNHAHQDLLVFHHHHLGFQCFIASILCHNLGLKHSYLSKNDSG